MLAKINGVLKHFPSLTEFNSFISGVAPCDAKVFMRRLVDDDGGVIEKLGVAVEGFAIYDNDGTQYPGGIDHDGIIWVAGADGDGTMIGINGRIEGFVVGKKWEGAKG
jgi:hypothetical protein